MTGEEPPCRACLRLRDDPSRVRAVARTSTVDGGGSRPALWLAHGVVSGWIPCRDRIRAELADVVGRDRSRQLNSSASAPCRSGPACAQRRTRHGSSPRGRGGADGCARRSCRSRGCQSPVVRFWLRLATSGLRVESRMAKRATALRVAGAGIQRGMDSSATYAFSRVVGALMRRAAKAARRPKYTVANSTETNSAVRPASM